MSFENKSPEEMLAICKIEAKRKLTSLDVKRKYLLSQVKEVDEFISSLRKIVEVADLVEERSENGDV